jgi:carboxylesterase type B
MKHQTTLIHRRSTILLVSSLIAILLQSLTSVASAQEPGGAKAKTKPDRWEQQPHLTEAAVRMEERVYKSTPQGELKLHLWSPEKTGEDRPCIVFFFGGGWTSGSYRQFARQSAYLASRGMVAASAEYRIRSLPTMPPIFHR